MVTLETQSPPMPARLRAAYNVWPDGMQVTFRPRQWGAAVFLTFWLAGWSVGCAFIAREVFLKQQLFLLLFGVPFWSAWFFVFALVLSFYFRRQDLEVDAHELRYVDRVLIRIKSRTVPRDELRGFELAKRDSSGNNSDTTPQAGLEIRTAGKPLWVFPGMPEMELRWLAYQLSGLVEAPASDAPAETLPLAEASSGALAAVAAPLSESLALGDEPVAPPSDSAWELLPDFGALEFVHRGRFSWPAVLGLLFINCFWNGIVGVFVLNLFGKAPGHAPADGEWWSLFLFLIPFEAIGLAMIVGLLVALVEPFRRTVWRFDALAIVRRVTWLGAGPRWTYPVESTARIDLVRRPGRAGAQTTGIVDTSELAGGESRFALSIVRPDNTQICQINGLTDGEARWMADAVLRELPEGFR